MGMTAPASYIANYLCVPSLLGTLYWLLVAAGVQTTGKHNADNVGIVAFHLLSYERQPKT